MAELLTAIMCPRCWTRDDKSPILGGSDGGIVGWRAPEVGDPCRECGEPLVLVAPVEVPR